MMVYELLMAGVAPAALCSADDGSGDGGSGGGGGDSGTAGGAASLLDNNGDGSGGGGNDGDGGSGGGGDDASKWLEQFSADADGDKPSNRDWLSAKGVKTADDLVKSYREAEHALRNGGKLAVPGENATPEEIETYHKAIGRPETVEGYEFTMPDGVAEDALDSKAIDVVREAAFKAGAPAGAFKGMMDAYIAHQLDEIQQYNTDGAADRDALLKSWGSEAPAKQADVQRAAQLLGIGKAEIGAFERGYAMTFGKPGASFVLNLLQKIGAGAAEDAFQGGGSQRRFGVTGAEAQAEIDKLIADKDFGAKLTAKDPEAVARWDRLNAAVAADRDAKARAAAS